MLKNISLSKVSKFNTWMLSRPRHNKLFSIWIGYFVNLSPRKSFKCISSSISPSSIFSPSYVTKSKLLSSGLYCKQLSRIYIGFQPPKTSTFLGSMFSKEPSNLENGYIMKLALYSGCSSISLICIYSHFAFLFFKSKTSQVLFIGVQFELSMGSVNP